MKYSKDYLDQLLLGDLPREISFAEDGQANRLRLALYPRRKELGVEVEMSVKGRTLTITPRIKDSTNENA